jgi:hypothetical protein
VVGHHAGTVTKFDVHGSVHRKYIPMYIQQDPALHSLFISGKCSTCFGCYFHPSSGTHTTLSTASGICRTVPAAIVEETELQFQVLQLIAADSSTVRQITDAVDTVVCAPDDERK